MDSYRLENSEMDRQFLSGEVVRCRAVRSRKDDWNTAPGSPLVVELSNGRKYKGRIVSFENIPLGGHQFGDLLIVKG